MKILVDTSIWSLALRREKPSQDKEDPSLVKEFIELIKETRVVLIGPIRQELLSGISNATQFHFLKEKLGAFEDFPISTPDYELAADFQNQCRKKGIQGSHIDFLICAVSARNTMAIFTREKDFLKYSDFIPIVLHKIRI